MTVGTDSRQHVCHRNLAWCMRVLVAVETLNMFRAVRLSVAGCTLRHDIRVILFNRIVSVENFVAFTAVELVLAARFFQLTKMAGVALAALSHC